MNGLRERLQVDPLTLFGGATFITATVVIVGLRGIPGSSLAIFGWIALGLFSVSVRSPRTWLRGLIMDWSPLFIVLFAYNELHVRFGDHLLRTAHVTPQIRVDEWLGGGVTPTVRLQQALWTEGHPHLWDWFAFVVYHTHFTVTIAIALVMWKTASPAFRQFVALFAGITTLGYITYAVFPAVPPWMASQQHVLADTSRIVRDLWLQLGQPGIAALFSDHSTYANDVAAVPSLHAAYPLSLLLFFWSRTGWRIRALMAVYAVAMAFTLIYSSEHYLIDVLLGWLYAVVVWLVIRGIWNRRADADRGARAIPSAEAVA